MRRPRIILFPLLTLALLTCAVPKPHRFVFQYNASQAMRICREVLREQGYRMAVYDAATGVLKTEPREFMGQNGKTVRYQVAITVIRRHELRIGVIPNAALDYRDQIMEPLIELLRKAGIEPEYIPPPRSRPKRWRGPPPPPPPLSQ
jgi:hypothetical protein